MPGEYAQNTTVPVTRSRDEIERILMRFGASSFGYAIDQQTVVIAFEIKSVRVKMMMPLPPPVPATDRYGRKRAESAVQKDYEQACRQRWRTLANAVKAKLAMIDDGISTVEKEFFSDIVTETGKTIWERRRELPVFDGPLAIAEAERHGRAG